jgi:hypothetical protein
MTTPETNHSDDEQTDDSGIPAANPSYAVPPPEGLPDAENS